MQLTNKFAFQSSVQFRKEINLGSLYVHSGANHRSEQQTAAQWSVCAAHTAAARTFHIIYVCPKQSTSKIWHFWRVVFAHIRKVHWFVYAASPQQASINAAQEPLVYRRRRIAAAESEWCFEIRGVNQRRGRSACSGRSLRRANMALAPRIGNYSRI